MRIELEPGDEPPPRSCPECGAPLRQLQWFVYADGAANAVAYADRCAAPVHDRPRTWITLAFGEWAEGTSGADRFAVCLAWWDGGMALIDEPVRESDLLGIFAPREEALTLDGVEHLWDVADAVATAMVVAL
ncbi:MAG: hypothetical protein JWQ18_3353 [Conexibacter sp.]|nr:hypothetical protein [Conexibacter sp.]